MTELDIYTDDNCNIPKQWLAENSVGFLPLGVLLDGHECSPELIDNPTEFYAQIRAGHKPSTSSIPALLVLDTFENSLKIGHDVLYIGLPAALSSNFEHVQSIASELNQKYLDAPAKIHCMDARIACTGHGILVQEAVRLRNLGKSLADIAPKLETLTDHMIITYMLNDIQYLRAGGRAENVVEQIAKMAARLKIKPVLTINKMCTITFYAISRKRSKGIEQMIKLLLAGMDKSEPQVIHVLHADALALANSMMDAIKEALGHEQKTELREVAPVIGSHVGPGTVALVYKLANART
ncbi:hypothetical protein FACS1894104_5750 [Actinomycetota bacterium]|nr:hypothetical protein FACS1894104_5750 [Actinomycetota bacterium]